MEEKEFRLESRLMAIEFMLTHLYNLSAKLAGATEELISRTEQDALKGLAMNPIEGADKLTPVQKDHLSSEVLLDIERLFDIARRSRN
ncbi:hypothetical protein [Brucella sp. 191011898]|uniref:hypothetical protein n=1 Tax=Brucella sp. 191011898 TaxID=2730447 RepID=UPI0015DFD2D1|nr:hypothetical protein [Brucella sp. 191011898]CAB4324926.1 hypothetical protein BCH_00140 [Brucella sp. 191011898]